MKQKILFYGNCQVGVIARFFRLNLFDKFDIQICSDCDLETFWNEPGLFAVWSTANRKNQKDYIECVHSKIREADIFVFQPHDGGRWLFNELQTEYLHDFIASGLKICIPDTRFFVYLPDKVSLYPFVEYVKKIVNTPEEIVNYLKSSDDPMLENILKNEYPFNMEFERYRKENRQRYEESLTLYENSINMCDFMEKEFKNKLIAVSHNHMAECYYIEMLKKLYNLLNIDESNYPIRNIEFPGMGVTYIDPRQFKFFSKIFPNFPFEENFKGRDLTISDVT